MAKSNRVGFLFKMIKIRKNIGMIPGGALFKDPRIPSKRWEEAAFIDDRVRDVIKFRSYNPGVYDRVKDADAFDFNRVTQEVTLFNYERLARNPDYFIEVPDVVPVPHYALTDFCGCDVPLEPRYCATCITKKIIGYRCPKCGRLYDNEHT